MPKAPAPDDEVVLPLRIVCTLEVDDPLLMEAIGETLSASKLRYARGEIEKLMQALDLDLQRVAADYTTKIGAIVERLSNG